MTKQTTTYLICLLLGFSLVLAATTAVAIHLPSSKEIIPAAEVMVRSLDI